MLSLSWYQRQLPWQEFETKVVHCCSFTNFWLFLITSAIVFKGCGDVLGPAEYDDDVLGPAVLDGSAETDENS